ncbi:MAG: hypothetical protein ABJG88_04295 [Litorimonas sp.]
MAQEEIIKYLLSDEQVLDIAKSIAKLGLNPLESCGVVKRKGDAGYYAAEGNRRLCALKLLINPRLAPAGARTPFEKLSKTSKHPKTLKVVVFKSYKEARPWLELLHGSKSGAGRRQLGSDQKSRFSGEDRNALALATLDYAERRGFITYDQRQKTLTTAARYLGNPTFRKTLGITSSIREQEIKLNKDKGVFDKGIQRFCQDLCDNSESSTVTSRSKAVDWVAYAEKIKEEEGLSDTITEEHKIDLGATTKKRKPRKKKPKPSPDDRPSIIPDNCVIEITDPKLQRLYDELRTIECDKFPFGSAYLLRTFLENVCVDYHRAKIGPFERSRANKLHICMKNICKHITDSKLAPSKPEKPALARLKRAANNDQDLLSPNTLGVFVHGANIPDPKQLKREWDNIQAIIELMLK